MNRSGHLQGPLQQRVGQARQDGDQDLPAALVKVDGLQDVQHDGQQRFGQMRAQRLHPGTAVEVGELAPQSAQRLFEHGLGHPAHDELDGRATFIRARNPEGHRECAADQAIRQAWHERRQRHATALIHDRTHRVQGLGQQVLGQIRRQRRDRLAAHPGTPHRLADLERPCHQFIRQAARQLVEWAGARTLVPEGRDHLQRLREQARRQALDDVLQRERSLALIGKGSDGAQPPLEDGLAQAFLGNR